MCGTPACGGTHFGSTQSSFKVSNNNISTENREAAASKVISSGVPQGTNRNYLLGNSFSYVPTTAVWVNGKKISESGTYVKASNNKKTESNNTDSNKKGILSGVVKDEKDLIERIKGE